MATFTATVPLDIHWRGLDLKGPAGALHAIPDAMVDVANEDLRGKVPGFRWIAPEGWASRLRRRARRFLR
jgi:hypothetical protein